MSTDNGANTPTPGWYPDPVGGTGKRSLRYWDGRSWSSETASVADGAAGSPGEHRPRRRRLVAFLRLVKWGSVAAFVLSAGVIINALASGQQVKSVNAMSGEVEFATETERDVQRQQPEIEARLMALEASVQDQAGEATTPSVNLAGSWTGDNSLLYEIDQLGDQAVIVEVVPEWGGIVSAYGVGQVVGQEFWFEYWGYNGATGEGRFTLAPDNVTLDGIFMNPVFGQTPARLTRI